MSRIVCSISVAWSLSSGSVWIRMLSEPEVFTIGDSAAGMSESSAVCATASRIFSTLAWVASPDFMETRYSTPPSNSMPRLRPLPSSP